MKWDQIFAALADRKDLSNEQVTWGMSQILEGAASNEDIKAFLTGLKAKGESAQEVEALVAQMYKYSAAINITERAVDTVGTGGDGANTFNISTTCAFVVAAAGAQVAKHGNRAASSKAGAADTLEVLGLDMHRAGLCAEASLRDIGIAFLFAANHHPAMKRITPIRQRLGRRTIFNLMGPLANPAGVQRQLIGIARPDYAATYAAALEQLGTEAALVVSGEEGLDELSSAGRSVAVSVGQVDLPGIITPSKGSGAFPSTTASISDQFIPASSRAR